MNAFFLLYALAISIELLLTLVMAIFIFLIVAPKGGSLHVPHEEPAARPLARTLPGALGDAFATVSEGRNDLATISNARSLLARYAREHEHQHGHAQRGTIQS
jgi:hypothetical protein